jgi:HEPN domain-containing protein
MQPEVLREARDWLTRAERDLLAAAGVLQGAIVLSEMAAYHAQQAMEKALKAFLTAHNRPFPKTHDLERLVRWCENVLPAFTQFVATAQTLNPYASQFRYPGGPLEPSRKEAEEALRMADAVLRFVRQEIVGEEQSEMPPGHAG